MIRKPLSLVAAVLMMLLVSGSATATDAPSVPGSDHTIVPGRILIQWRDTPVPSRLLSGGIGADLSAPTLVGPPGLIRYRVPAGRETQMVALLNGDPRIEFAEPDFRIEAFDTIPNDTHYSLQWALPRINAPTAWDIETGSSSIVIAVLDTGVQLDHPDLSANLVPGFDFVNNDSSPADDHGHGSHVAGIAAAVSDNGAGVAGLAWGARIMPLKVLDSTGSGSTSDVVSAIEWAVNHGASVINLSLGGPSDSYALRNAIDSAHAAGVVVVASMGNEYLKGDPTLYPAANSNVIAVAASDQSDEHASFSSSGDHADITAPGVTIASTYTGSSYVYMSGTSMAAPYVSGLAALVRSAAPHLTPDEVEELLEQSAVDLGDPGWDPYFGHGRIDALAALSGAIGDPATSTPTLTATPSATVTTTPTHLPPTAASTETPTPTATEATATPTPTSTPTSRPPIATPTGTVTPTSPTITATSSVTATFTSVPTSAATETATPTPTPTETPTSPAASSTPTATFTSVASTSVPTGTATTMATEAPSTSTATVSATLTVTTTPSATPAGTVSPTTPLPPSATSTPSMEVSPTPTTIVSSTVTPSPTLTAIATDGPDSQQVDRVELMVEPAVLVASSASAAQVDIKILDEAGDGVGRKEIRIWTSQDPEALEMLSDAQGRVTLSIGAADEVGQITIYVAVDDIETSALLSIRNGDAVELNVAEAGLLYLPFRGGAIGVEVEVPPGALATRTLLTLAPLKGSEVPSIPGRFSGMAMELSAFAESSYRPGLRFAVPALLSAERVAGTEGDSMAKTALLYWDAERGEWRPGSCDESVALMILNADSATAICGSGRYALVELAPDLLLPAVMR